MTRCSRADAVLKERLAALRSSHLERWPRIFLGPAGPKMSTPDGVKINFCSNDYLGLADDPALKEIAAASIRRWGTGAGASRLVSGTQKPHDALETQVAAFMDAEAALLFASGYQANVGALSALATRGDVIFSDELVHASLIDGARLSKADVHVFRHKDMTHLESLLDSVPMDGLRLIVTDAVFSMDGDAADLESIVELAEAHDALVYLDEAHALGVIGERGAGLAQACGLTKRIAVRIGTFSKAFGAFGAFVAGSRDIVSLLRSTARSFLFSTAPPAALAEAISASLTRVEGADDLRMIVRQNIELFRVTATERALPLLSSETPIQPILTGNEIRTMAVSDALWERGFFVHGIRPPSVPEGKSRLRVAISAKHTEKQIVHLVDALARALDGIAP